MLLVYMGISVLIIYLQCRFCTGGLLAKTPSCDILIAVTHPSTLPLPLPFLTLPYHGTLVPLLYAAPPTVIETSSEVVKTLMEG